MAIAEVIFSLAAAVIVSWAVSYSGFAASWSILGRWAVSVGTACFVALLLTSGMRALPVPHQPLQALLLILTASAGFRIGMVKDSKGP